MQGSHVWADMQKTLREPYGPHRKHTQTWPNKNIEAADSKQICLHTHGHRRPNE